MTSDIKTIERFDYAWKKFAADEVKKNWRKDSFSYVELIPKDIFPETGSIGLDAGCGSGADLINISKKGLRMVGIDPTEAVKIARANTKDIAEIDIIQANIQNLPFKKESFNLVYSFGVLHHLKNPEDAFKKLVSLVKSSGLILVYVYEKFSNRTILERFGLLLVSAVRIFSSRLNPRILYGICIILSPFVLFFFSVPAKVLSMFSFTKRISQRLPFRHTLRIDCLIADLYDRFSPPIEKRYDKEEIKKWLEDASLKDINIVNYRGWVAWGRKK